MVCRKKRGWNSEQVEWYCKLSVVKCKENVLSAYMNFQFLGYLAAMDAVNRGSEVTMLLIRM